MPQWIHGKLGILFLLVFMLAIFLSSSVVPDRIIKNYQFGFEINPIFQDLIHIPIFTVFTIFLLIVLRRFEKLRLNQIVTALILSNYVGALNELIQLVVPGRCASFKDMGLNLFGSILGIVLCYTFLRETHMKREMSIELSVSSPNRP